jgi:hypothetical protein
LFKGKFGEIKVILHLLSKGYMVYTPIIDTGIDFVIEPPRPVHHRFIGVQVKTSTYQKASDWWMWTIYKDDTWKGGPFFYILSFEDINELPEKIRKKAENGVLCFVLPYDTVDKMITDRSKAWVKKGEFCLSINRKSFESGGSRWLKDLYPYLNKWDLLK